MPDAVGILMVVVADIAPLGHHCGWNRQPGGIIIPAPLAYAPHKMQKDGSQNQKKYQEKQ